MSMNGTWHVHRPVATPERVLTILLITRVSLKNRYHFLKLNFLLLLFFFFFFFFFTVLQKWGSDHIALATELAFTRSHEV